MGLICYVGSIVVEFTVDFLILISDNAVLWNVCICEAKPSLPTNFEDTTWENLQSAIRAIFLKQPFPFDLERLYQVKIFYLSLLG